MENTGFKALVTEEIPPKQFSRRIGTRTIADLPVNVFTCILRGASLLGIDSAQCPMQLRLKVWHKLATQWRLDNLAAAVHEIDLDGLKAAIQTVLNGKTKGRTIISHT